jgi:branched-chain amino acid transport system permease protein
LQGTPPAARQSRFCGCRWQRRRQILHVPLGILSLRLLERLMGFFLETLFGGLMAGMLYSLVALGFVLIYKASGVFNFAQGAMVLFAALAMARFSEWIPRWTGIDSLIFANLAAFAIAAVIMFAVAWVIERLVLRHLVNQEGATLLMATLGITYFMEGLGQTLFGSSIYKIDIGMPKEPIFVLDSMFPGGILLNKEDLIAAAIAAALVALLSVFFQKTSTGRALRAVADDHQAAQSIGIPLNRIWVVVWCVAGVVALVAGMIWGSKLGVQFSLTTVALRALPVVILGGLTSVPGAIIGGLIIGVGEKLSEVYLGPYVGGGIEIWFAYVLALGFLLFRPQGLFGEKIIDRV